ncbi:MAG: bifunctional nuclease family protein [Candidatus Aenigmarchaeota archaeon]|nr:bifunctional nuclease family protein [Candidatus Aenigmarchaeota archaeon]
MKKHFPLLNIVLILALLTTAYAVVSHYSSDGYVLANKLQIQDNTIVIGYDCKAIVAETSPERAYAIQLGLENKIDKRPVTHDAFVETLESFNITLEAVKINRYDGNYYYSDMIMSNSDKVLSLDTMPSDAIAIAVRLKAPIYINSTLLDEVGENIC